MQLRTTRTAGWIAGSILLGAALIAPAAALAQDTTQTLPISSTSFTDPNCTGGPGGADITVGKNEVAWVFVHSGVDATTGTLTATFAGAGQKTATGYVQGGLKYLIVTAKPESVTAFSDDVAGGKLVLSHVCFVPDPTPTPTPTPSPTPTVEIEPTPTPTPTPTGTPPGAPKPTPTGTPPGAPKPTPTPTATPSSSVEAATGTPKTTPPPTDSVGGGSSGSGWGVAMLALGGLSALAVVLVPARKRR